MELNLELNLKLLVRWVGGWTETNACQSTELEVVLEVGFELLNSTRVNVHSIYIFSTTSPDGWWVGGWWMGGRIKRK